MKEPKTIRAFAQVSDVTIQMSRAFNLDRVVEGMAREATSQIMRELFHAATVTRTVPEGLKLTDFRQQYSCSSTYELEVTFISGKTWRETKDRLHALEAENAKLTTENARLKKCETKARRFDTIQRALEPIPCPIADCTCFLDPSFCKAGKQ